ncbi:hypothetical protein BDV96DRAFT_582497 [Lophiotrema nucula]|uniref:SnoaL-like domain-containing protein n=1 Tax=Lophiotrema nucula TaxID=690887 RepID=A0A6A5YWB7_9PLEO|nr:hypothetical protein BDV96DRAFT_582497 [Lophiotrema nucula]
MASIKAPLSASSLYQTLHATAIELVKSQEQTPERPERMDHERIRAIRSENRFEHTWGHNYLVSTRPHLSGTHDVDGFIKHVGTMLPKLESWDTDIRDVVVDEFAKRAIVRASYWMKPKGSEEPVENDIVWFLDMEEDGKRVKKSVEFVDAAATGRIMEIMMKQAGQVNGAK